MSSIIRSLPSMSRRAVLGLRYTSTRTQTRSTSETATFQEVSNSQPASGVRSAQAAPKEDANATSSSYKQWRGQVNLEEEVLRRAEESVKVWN